MAISKVEVSLVIRSALYLLPVCDLAFPVPVYLLLRLSVSPFLPSPLLRFRNLPLLQELRGIHDSAPNRSCTNVLFAVRHLYVQRIEPPID